MTHFDALASFQKCCLFLASFHLKVAVMATPANWHVLHHAALDSLQAFMMASWASDMAWQAKCACASANCHNEGGGQRNQPTIAMWMLRWGSPEIMAMQNISNSETRVFFVLCQAESTSQTLIEEVPARDVRASPVPTEVLLFWFFVDAKQI